MSESNEVNERLKEYRQQRIAFFKTSLNIFRGRCWSINTANGLLKSQLAIDSDTCSLPELHKSVEHLQNSVCQLLSLSKAIAMVQTNISFHQLLQAQENSIVNEVNLFLRHVALITKKVLALYNETEEVSFVGIKETYAQQVSNWNEHVGSDDGPAETSARRLAKARLQVEKVNMMRAMTSLLIATFADNHKHLADLQTLRSSLRKNFRIDDFC